MQLFLNRFYSEFLMAFLFSSVVYGSRMFEVGVRARNSRFLLCVFVNGFEFLTMRTIVKARKNTQTPCPDHVTVVYTHMHTSTYAYTHTCT